MDEEKLKATPPGGRLGRAPAIASLVFALLAAGASTFLIWFFEGKALFCFGLLLAIPAVMLAFGALRGSKRTPRPKGTRPIAISGLVVGSLTLAWLLLFMYRAFESNTRICRSSCKSNLKRIGLALYIYSTDYDGWFPIGPPGTDSSYALGILAYGDEEGAEPYVFDAGLLLCPSSDDIIGGWRLSGRGRSAQAGGLRPSTTSYTYLPGFRADSWGNLMVLFDKRPVCHLHRKTWLGVTFTRRKEPGRNVLFVDGDVKYLEEEEFRGRLGDQEKLLEWVREVANRDELFR